MVSSEFLRPEDRVLIIDDFFAMGNTIAALARLVEKARATLVGIGALVEKTFEGGRERLTDFGVPIESLVLIDEIRDDGTVILAE